MSSKYEMEKIYQDYKEQMSSYEIRSFEEFLRDYEVLENENEKNKITLDYYKEELSGISQNLNETTQTLNNQENEIKELKKQLEISNSKNLFLEEQNNELKQDLEMKKNTLLSFKAGLLLNKIYEKKNTDWYKNEGCKMSGKLRLAQSKFEANNCTNSMYISINEYESVMNELEYNNLLNEDIKNQELAFNAYKNAEANPTKENFKQAEFLINNVQNKDVAMYLFEELKHIMNSINKKEKPKKILKNLFRK